MVDVIEMLRDVGGLVSDSHVVYASGKHGSVYLNKDAIYPFTEKVAAVCAMFAERHRGLPIDVVVGPALGGIILSQWTASHLSRLTGRTILGVYTEKSADGRQILTRGYDRHIREKNVLVVEDIANTGGSVRKVIESVSAAGGRVLAATVMIDRSLGAVNSELLGVPYSALAVFKADAFDAPVCPLCRQGVPINTEVGHGRRFAERSQGLP